MTNTTMHPFLNFKRALHTQSFIVVFAAVFFTQAQTNLSGSIGGMTLTKEGNPFLVTDNITIPAGKTLTIQDGCVFLFNPFTGINVEGTLEVKGTLEQPVIFTSFNNKQYNPIAPQEPDPFDWNGIIIGTKAKLVNLAYFVLSYSVYGIKSSRDDIMITSGTFISNGQFHFTIYDEIQAVSDNIPFNYVPVANPNSAPKPKLIVAPWKRPVSVIAMLFGSGGLGAMGYFLYEKNQIHQKYLDTTNTQDQRDRYIEKEYNTLIYTTIAGISGGLLLSTGIIILATDVSDRNKAKLTVSPIVGTSLGLLATIDVLHYTKRISEK